MVRHCQSSSQKPDAPLTTQGKVQAKLLADFFLKLQIDRIVSSPFLRARQSVMPLAEKLGIPVEIDERLKERLLSTPMLPDSDWLQQLRRSFNDLNLCLPGGESSHAAMLRAVAVIDEIWQHDATVTLIATHGNLMTLLLKHFNSEIGFLHWKSLTNPDVYSIVTNNEGIEIKRLWQMKTLVKQLRKTDETFFQLELVQILSAKPWSPTTCSTKFYNEYRRRLHHFNT